MNLEYFINKFSVKSNKQIEEIAYNNVKYDIEARVAAIIILKERKIDSKVIKMVENDFLIHKQKRKLEIIKESKLLKKINNQLSIISIKKKLNIILNNGNELQIKRLNKQFFELKILHSKSYLSPIVIYKYHKEKINIHFPFFNLNIIIISFFIGLIIIAFNYYHNGSIREIALIIASIPFILTIIIQIILMPIMYKLIVKTFNEEMEKLKI